MIDLDGAVKIMTAAEKQRSNVLLWSALSEWEEEITRQIQEDSSLKIYTIAKNYADEWLKTRTELDWTIIHPNAYRQRKYW